MSYKTLISTYQNHVLNNANYNTYWEFALNNNKNLKNDDGLFQPNAFHTICNTFFNYVASTGRPIATGDCLLHYMYSGKKKPHYMTPQSFYTRFQKALFAVKLLGRCCEKELDGTKAKSIFFYSFHREHIQDYICHSQCKFDDKTLEDLKNFFQGNYDTNTPKKNEPQTNCQNDKGQASSQNCVLFTNHDDANPPTEMNTTSSCCHTE